MNATATSHRLNLRPNQRVNHSYPPASAATDGPCEQPITTSQPIILHDNGYHSWPPLTESLPNKRFKSLEGAHKPLFSELILGSFC